MAINNLDSMRLIVDIETAPIDDAAEYLDLSDIQAPANYKDEAKIAAYCEGKRSEMVNRAALDLDLCRVVALGFMREDWNDPEVLVAPNDAHEAAIIEAFWRQLGQRASIGYNSIGFDLCVLLRRSLYLGVHSPMLNLDKYRTPHIDLQQRLSFNGTKPYRSLDWYCKRLKLDVPADDNTGREIGQLVKDGNWDAVADHCRADVIKTAKLAERMGVLKRHVEAEMVL